MIDRDQFKDFEEHVAANYGVGLEHHYDRRLIRRMFAGLNFHSQFEPAGQAAAAVEEWPSLAIYRDGRIQRAVLDALRVRKPLGVISNLQIPVDVEEAHKGITQRMFDSAMRDYLREKHLRTPIPLSQMHEEFARWFLLSLVSDRLLIVETDFSHEKNMALKYIVRPWENNILRTPPISHRSNLFFSKRIMDVVKHTTYVGVEPTLAAIFNREIGFAEFEDATGEPVIGPAAQSGFLVFASKRRDYNCAYIAPLYALINRDSSMIHRLTRLYDTMMDILGSEAYYRIERNKHHSRLRHTIGVEVRQLSKVYASIFEQRTELVNSYSGDATQLNIDLSRVSGLVHELGIDVSKQFDGEFDVFGNRSSSSSDGEEIVLLTATAFKDLIKEIAGYAAGKNAKVHMLLNLEHEQAVQVASESALRISLTEILNNAVKYNITNDRIRVRTRDRGNEVFVSITNFGPPLSQQEEDLLPLMGLRGIRSQRHVVEGSGQGLATIFDILEAMDIEVKYRQRPLTREQATIVSASIGSKRLSELGLTSHTIELSLQKERNRGG